MEGQKERDQGAWSGQGAGASLALCLVNSPQRTGGVRVFPPSPFAAFHGSLRYFWVCAGSMHGKENTSLSALHLPAPPAQTSRGGGGGAWVGTCVRGGRTHALPLPAGTGQGAPTWSMALSLNGIGFHVLWVTVFRRDKDMCALGTEGSELMKDK